jgi:Arc/MetJ-type ribon-helix-helix transcriptional regulator
MIKVQVSLPGPLKRFIDGLVAEGAFKDLSDYLQTLIARDRQAREKAASKPCSSRAWIPAPRRR